MKGIVRDPTARSAHVGGASGPATPRLALASTREQHCASAVSDCLLSGGGCSEERCRLSWGSACASVALARKHVNLSAARTTANYAVPTAQTTRAVSSRQRSWLAVWRAVSSCYRAVIGPTHTSLSSTSVHARCPPRGRGLPKKEKGMTTDLLVVPRHREQRIAQSHFGPTITSRDHEGDLSNDVPMSPRPSRTVPDPGGRSLSSIVRAVTRLLAVARPTISVSVAGILVTAILAACGGSTHKGHALPGAALSVAVTWSLGPNPVAGICTAGVAISLTPTTTKSRSPVARSATKALTLTAPVDQPTVSQHSCTFYAPVLTHLQAGDYRIAVSAKDANWQTSCQTSLGSNSTAIDDARFTIGASGCKFVPGT